MLVMGKLFIEILLEPSKQFLGIADFENFLFFEILILIIDPFSEFLLRFTIKKSINIYSTMIDKALKS